MRRPVSRSGEVDRSTSVILPVGHGKSNIYLPWGSDLFGLLHSSSQDSNFPAQDRLEMLFKKRDLDCSPIGFHGLPKL